MTGKYSGFSIGETGMILGGSGSWGLDDPDPVMPVGPIYL